MISGIDSMHKVSDIITIDSKSGPMRLRGWIKKKVKNMNEMNLARAAVRKDMRRHNETQQACDTSRLHRVAGEALEKAGVHPDCINRLALSAMLDVIEGC
jgi:hypothetical protein